MKPDRAHRTLNTVLLVFILAVQSIDGSPATEGFGEQLMAVAIYGAMVVLIFLMVRVAVSNRDEIVEYLTTENHA